LAAVRRFNAGRWQALRCQIDLAPEPQQAKKLNIAAMNSKASGGWLID
jgi:hypothetical protein